MKIINFNDKAFLPFEAHYYPGMLEDLPQCPACRGDDAMRVGKIRDLSMKLGGHTHLLIGIGMRCPECGIQIEVSALLGIRST